MQRRKRRATQTTRKKTEHTPSVTGYYPTQVKTGSGRKTGLFFLAIIVLGALAYYFYSIGLPFSDKDTAESGTTEMEQPRASEAAPPVREELTAPFEHKIQIEILNGCGVNGVAKLFQDYLRNEGFDVVNTENYTVKGQVQWDVKESFLIDHIGITEKAKKVAKSLNIPLTRIEHRETKTPIYDVSVVIGKDYKRLLPQ